ncbi:hypothetical protein FRB96_001081 [Tulasnella sp. 330]|nr:hypothetical protein FRB96_001081 [Tulasnella sp. 330]KAG8872438.1 hypothetical protein FRB97_007630 [Tulasnella sp. 331]
MFTPPPSPVPARRPISLELPSSRTPGRKGSEHGDDSDTSSDTHSFIEEGSIIITPPTPPAPTRKLSLPHPPPRASRRIWIPLFAVVLVCLAVGASSLGKGLPPIPVPQKSKFFEVRQKSQPSSKPGSTWSSLHFPSDASSWRTHLLKHTASLRRKRQVLSVSSVSGTATASAAAASSSLTSSTSSSSVTGSATIPDPPNPVPTPFPQPFDTVFSFNFTTTSCQSFFASSLISNITFRSCRPLSLLIPSSSAFISAQSNLTLLTSIVGGTCDTTGATEDECLDTMSYLADEIKKDTVCGKDLADENALAVEALTGFRNYGFMRQADAVASPSPSDFYFFTLPLGTPLPNNTVPSCSTCTESLLAIYATQASNSSLLISKTYAAAADIAIKGCGARYAIAMDSTSGALAAARVGEAGMRRMMLVGVLMGVLGGVLSVGI